MWCTFVLLWPLELIGTELPVDPVSSWTCGIRYWLCTSVVSKLITSCVMECMYADAMAVTLSI